MNNKITLALILLVSISLVSLNEIQYADAAEIGDVLSVFKINGTTPNGPTLDRAGSFGSSIANIGDINGDGIDDIAVGSPKDSMASGRSNHAGAVNIMTLNATGYPLSTFKIDMNTPNGPIINQNDAFGWSIAGMGDIDGDGVNDIAVGAYIDDIGDQWSDAGSDVGSVHIIFLNSDGSPKSSYKIENSTANGPHLYRHDYFGWTVANIGDRNEDGINDIAVGAPGDNSAGYLRGAVHIITLNSDGSPKSFAKINADTPNGPDLSKDAWLGGMVANIGDINGDGIDDIAVGSPNGSFIYQDGKIGGAVHLMMLNSTGFPINTVTINGTTPNSPDISWQDKFGASVSGIGDLDGNGTPDIAVGAYNDGEPIPDSIQKDWAGVVHIILLNSDGSVKDSFELSPRSNLGDIDLSIHPGLGHSIANIGDRNNDGVDDIAVGIPRLNSIYMVKLYGALSTVADSPENLLTTPGDTLVNLTWGVQTDYNGPPITDYIIEYGDGIEWTLFDDGISTATSATVTGLINEQEYSFRVSAVNSVGTSEPTTSVSTTPEFTLFCGKLLSSYDNVIYGTDSDNYLIGTDGKDLIFGYGGNDLINGGKGNDCIFGGDGNDIIIDGRANDIIYAGDGDDYIRTSGGSDKVYGEDGNDKLYETGLSGSNVLDGGNGIDMCVVSNDVIEIVFSNCEIEEGLE